MRGAPRNDAIGLGTRSEHSEMHGRRNENDVEILLRSLDCDARRVSIDDGHDESAWSNEPSGVDRPCRALAIERRPEHAVTHAKRRSSELRAALERLGQFGAALGRRLLDLVRRNEAAVQERTLARRLIRGRALTSAVRLHLQRRRVAGCVRVRTIERGEHLTTRDDVAGPHRHAVDVGGNVLRADVRLDPGVDRSDVRARVAIRRGERELHRHRSSGRPQRDVVHLAVDSADEKASGNREHDSADAERDELATMPRDRWGRNCSHVLDSSMLTTSTSSLAEHTACRHSCS